MTLLRANNIHTPSSVSILQGSGQHTTASTTPPPPLTSLSLKPVSLVICSCPCTAVCLMVEIVPLLLMSLAEVTREHQGSLFQEKWKKALILLEVKNIPFCVIDLQTLHHSTHSYHLPTTVSICVHAPGEGEGPGRSHRGTHLVQLESRFL